VTELIDQRARLLVAVVPLTCLHRLIPRLERRTVFVDHRADPAGEAVALGRNEVPDDLTSTPLTRGRVPAAVLAQAGELANDEHLARVEELRDARGLERRGSSG